MCGSDTRVGDRFIGKVRQTKVSLRDSGSIKILFCLYTFQFCTDLLFQNVILKNMTYIDKKLHELRYITHVHCTCIYMNKCIGLEVCSGVTSIAKDHNNCYKIEAILLCN